MEQWKLLNNFPLNIIWAVVVFLAWLELYQAVSYRWHFVRLEMCVFFIPHLLSPRLLDVRAAAVPIAASPVQASPCLRHEDAQAARDAPGWTRGPLFVYTCHWLRDCTISVPAWLCTAPCWLIACYWKAPNFRVFFASKTFPGKGQPEKVG